MSDLPVRSALRALGSGRGLDEDEAAAAVTQIIDGGATEGEVAALLGLLRAWGEGPAELAGAVRAVRGRMTALDVPDHLRPLLDVCGTGGDGADTVNISSAVALVVAACGVRVAKHGNRSASGRTGSAEIMVRLGVNVDPSPATHLRALEEVGITFLHAPTFHPALRHVAAVRKMLPFRTLFNLIGPLANPARVDVQLLGVPDERHANLVAGTLASLSASGGWPGRAAVVCSGDGLDEVSLGAHAYVRWVGGEGEDGGERIEPEAFGLPRHRSRASAPRMPRRASGPSEVCSTVRPARCATSCSRTPPWRFASRAVPRTCPRA